MLYYKFKNYSEFQDLFGFTRHGNGVKSRKNKILLALLKNKQLLHEAIASEDFSLLHISSMVELKQLITQNIIDSGATDDSLPYTVQLLGETYKSSTYSFDEYKGICEDSDYKAIRYFNHSNNQVFKMKAGKFYKSLILDTEFGRKLPEQVVTYLCEEFSQSWKSYSLQTMPKHTLYIDRDFERIYNSNHCNGDFCSCMSDKDYHYFYEYYVNSSAAYLENENSEIIARCIIFNAVTDEDGKVYRLAERQYSADGNTVLHRLLVDSLIKEGKIDGYKAIGAGCSDSRAFVDNDGNSLSHKKFSIDCTLSYENTLSYQDSFKWLDINSQIAYNYPSINYDVMLDTTDGELERDEEFDSYHDEYCYEVTSVYYQGDRITCNVDRLDDFVLFNNQYYHEDDIADCPHCLSRFILEDGHYSEVTEETYCCLDCYNEETEEE